MHGMSKLEIIKDPNALYRGDHIKHPKVLVLRGRSVAAEPLDGEVMLDVDGEAPGRLPAKFTLIPGGIPFRC